MTTSTSDPRTGLAWPMLLRPLSGGPLAVAAAVIWLAGAVYCLGYEGLSGGTGEWPLALQWSACAVLPWFALFEIAKRRRFRGGELAVALVVTGLISLALETGSDWLLGVTSSPVGLQILRRIPAIGASLLLILLAARAAPRPAATLDAVARAAPAARWIKAADNYLELHLPGRVLTVRGTMRDAEALLTVAGFARVHRSLIVNSAHVAAIDPRGRTVRMDDGTELPVGAAYMAQVRHLTTKRLPTAA